MVFHALDPRGSGPQTVKISAIASVLSSISRPILDMHYWQRDEWPLAWSGVEAQIFKIEWFHRPD
jgi:hypothetical protein